MKLPKSVRLAGHRWKIVVLPNNERGDHGETDLNTRTIYLYTDPHKRLGTSMKSTLFHELIHAALEITGAGALCSQKGAEEAIVCALENTLWPLIESGLLR